MLRRQRRALFYRDRVIINTPSDEGVPEGDGSYEDFTDVSYVETDLNNALTVAQYKITATNLSAENDDAFVIKDFGSGYFTSGTTINFELYVTSVADEVCKCAPVFLTNANDTWKDSVNGVGCVIDYSYNKADPAFELWAYAKNYAGIYQNTVNCGTLYYCTLVFTYGSTSSICLYVYSDAARETLIHSMEREDIPAANVAETYQYLGVASSWGDINDVETAVSFYVQNVEIVAH